MLKIKAMSKITMSYFLFIMLTLLSAGVSSSESNISEGDLYAVSDDDDGSNWARYGRNTKEQHYSPLTQINDKNIDRLGLAWSYNLPISPSKGSAPLAVDGVLYFAAGNSIIHAVKAKSGKLLWKYDPEVFKTAGHQHKMRGGWGGGVRGIAYSEGKIFTATLDGRLIAIDSTTGAVLWSVMTTEPNDGLYITGAPWVMKGKIIIGNGGADLAPVRGYVTAYDINTGKQAWRFYTVPGNPKDGFENKAMEMAAKTWTGDWWKFGGGGTVWNAMAYDKKLNRIYIGTGNGAPWNRKIRSPEGGDNLFLSSIVALDADTGEYIWHYQVNPGESWDYNAAMDIELAEITIDGRLRSVILHAPKNGFFYVIDRTEFSAIKRKEVYGTTGPRMTVRFFGGWEYEEIDALQPDMAKIGYSKGIPMGGDLTNAPKGKSPTFLIRAVKDPDGANLDRIQVIKGWRDTTGDLHEKIYNVALADGRKVLQSGKVDSIGSTVNVSEASYTNAGGDPELAITWQDPDFNDKELAFYYARVLEIPTPRWTAYDATFFGVSNIPKEVPMVT